MQINVIFEDKEIIIVEKPVGMPSQKDKSGAIDLVTKVKEQIKCDVWIVHRLDRPVGGLIVLAKTKESAAILSETIKNKEVKKIYRAVCCGNVPPSGKLSNYLMKNQRLNLSKIVNKGNVGAKLAELEFNLINRLDDDDYGKLSLIEVNLLTGRHHQIRAQMMNANTPLWGDTKYNQAFKHKRGVNVALWSYRLEIKHPVTNKIISFTSEPKGEIFTKLKGDKNEI